MKKIKEGEGNISIKFKLILLLVSLIIIPISVLGLTSYNSAKNVLSSELKKNSMQIAERLNSSIETFLISNEENINMLSKNANIEDALYKNEEELKYLYGVLQNYKEAHSDVMNVYLATYNKKLFIFPDAKLPEGFDPTSRPWYQQAIKEGKTIWTEPYIDQVSGKLTVTVAKPVKRSTGEFTGVVAADISLDTLLNIVNITKLGDKGYFFIADKKGTIVAHRDKSLVNKEIPVKNLLDEVSKNSSGIIDYSYEGESKFAILANNKRIGWNIIGVMDYSEISNNLSIIIKVVATVGVIISILGAIIGILASRPITQSLANLVEDMRRIGAGDLTVRSNVKSRDEIGTLASTLNLMAEDLGDLMKNITSISIEVNKASDTLAATAEETNSATEEIAKIIGEVAGTTFDQAKSTDVGLQKTNELSNSIQSVANAINHAKEIFNEANNLNYKGINTVKLLTEKTEETNKASQEVSDVVTEVDNTTNKIGSIIDTISQIAQQTNLLALNASIEAARAGEAGRGFAVVADEIRKLAEQSGTAARQIRDLIIGIQEQSKNAVRTMEGTKEVVIGQANVVVETEQIFKEITDTITGINDEIVRILGLNEGMIHKKNEIVLVMEDISASAQQTSAAVQETSASTEEQVAAFEEVTRTADELNQLAVKLNSEIEKFKV